MSPKEKPNRPIDVYVRVSRVAGREGDSFISPKEQEARCRAFLTSQGHEAGKVFIDLDQSGRKASRPEFDKAMERALTGVSGGIVVWKLSRFGRSTTQVLKGVRELEDAGAALLSTSESIDTSSAMGRFVLTIFAALTELESETIKDNWATAHSNMLERGVSSGPVPVGYVRGDDGKLAPSEWADVVREAYRLRAVDKVSYRALAVYLGEQGLPKRTAGAWTSSGARKLLANRTYLGEIRFGDEVRKDVHEALVDERTFRLANRKADAKTGYSRSEGPLLGAGLLRCGVCGAGMSKATATNSQGRKYVFYRCSSEQKGHVTISERIAAGYLLPLAAKRISEWYKSQPESEMVSDSVPEELTDALDLALSEIEALDAELQSGAISATVYAKASTKAEEDVVSLREQIAAVQDEGASTYLRLSDLQRDEAAANLSASTFTAMLDKDPEAFSPDQEDITRMRNLLKEHLGPITILPGRAPVEERVVLGK